MIGKVTKEVLYKAGSIVPDLRAIKILATIPDRKDDTIMNAIVKELEDEGIEVMDQTLLIKPLLPQREAVSSPSADRPLPITAFSHFIPRS